MVLSLIGGLLAPKLIKLSAVEEFLQQRFSEDIGARIEFQKIDLAWFPRPHVVVEGVSFSIKPYVSGDMNFLHIYPKLLPLLWGDFQLARLQAVDPAYTVRLSEHRSAKTGDPQTPTVGELLKDIHEVMLSFPEFTLSELKVRLVNGNLNIFEGDRQIFGFSDIHASYVRPANKTKFNLQCKSNLWDAITINGWLDTEAFSSQGSIRLAEFRPHTLSDFFFPDSSLKITEAVANLVIDFELNGPENLHASIEGAVPHLKFSDGKRHFEFDENTIKGAVQVKKNQTRVRLDNFDMRYPRINLSGELSMDPNQPMISLKIKGRKFNVESIRKVAMGIGENSPIVREVFNVIRGGEIPEITVTTHGRKFEDLADPDNIAVRGEMHAGKIFIPFVKLNLERVEGKVVISNGVLRGNSLRAKMGNSYGQNGKLKLGLNEKIDPFYLDILIQADLSQLPPILKRVVANKQFIRELELVKNVNGTALGKLILDINPQQVVVKVEASEARLKANYERFPHPLILEGGPFYFDQRHVGFSNFAAALGTSVFSNLTCSLKLQKAAQLTLASEIASLNIGEIYPWLYSIGAITGELRNINSIQGNIKIDTMSFSGPLFTPSKWELQSSGKIGGITAKSDNLPGPLDILQGQFKCHDTRITLQNVEAALGKSTISNLSGAADWGKANFLTITSGASKINLEDLYGRLLTLASVKNQLKKIKPMKGKLALSNLRLKAPFSGSKKRRIKMSAVVNSSVLDSASFPAPVNINSGEITWQDKRIGLSKCNGSVGKSTYSKLGADLDWYESAILNAKAESVILDVNGIWPWLTSLEGIDQSLLHETSAAGMIQLAKLNVKMPLNHPANWRLSATGEIQNITMEAAFLDESASLSKGKFIITERDLSGVLHNCIKLGSTHLIWGTSHSILIGDVIFRGDSLIVDLSISADNIEWNRVEKIIDYAEVHQSKDLKHTKQPAREIRLDVKSEKFRYDKYIFEPFYANIVLRPNEAVIGIDRADLCGVAISGIIKASDQNLEFLIVPKSRSSKLETTLACLTNEKASATGKFSLDGEVMAKSKPAASTRIYSGDLDFSAKNGRIYRMGLLAKIFAILNVTEIYRGEVPDLTGEGFGYNEMVIKADFKGKKIIMEECAIDGASMGLACEGEIDLVEDKINLVILVAPFKTVDRIVRNIPLVSSVLGGKIVSIPFRAKGDIDNPTVIPLSPTAVGSGVLGIMERTLKLPITIIQPLFPDETESKKKENPEPDN
jgi:hypothetical protein